MGLRARRLPSLHRVPVSPVPRLPRYYEAATTSCRANPSAYGFASGSRMFLAVRARLRAPVTAKPVIGPGVFVPPALRSRLFPYGHKQDLSGFLVTLPVPLPCSQTPTEPVSLAMAAFPVLPPDPTRRGLRRFHDFEAITGLRYPLSTLHERRCRRPCKTRFRLAGSAFAGRVSNPLGHDERFPATSFLLSRTYPDASWVHMRRPFYQFHASTKSPVAADLPARVASLCEIKAEIRGSPAEHRRAVRDARSRPIADALHVWLGEQLPRLPGSSDLAKAMRYALRHWDGLTVFLGDGRIEMDTNVVERAIRPVTLNRNYVQRRIMRSSAWRGCARSDLVGPLARSPSRSFA